MTGQGISISRAGAAQIQLPVAEKGMPKDGLRAKVVGGGCSGLTCRMDVDEPQRRGVRGRQRASWIGMPVDGLAANVQSAVSINEGDSIWTTAPYAY
jgi:Fe-S cluster assembly iron-binding protein IscA